MAMIIVILVHLRMVSAASDMDQFSMPHRAGSGTGPAAGTRPGRPHRSCHPPPKDSAGDGSRTVSRCHQSAWTRSAVTSTTT